MYKQKRNKEITERKVQKDERQRNKEEMVRLY
jgi:hypothetical protein